MLQNAHMNRVHLGNSRGMATTRLFGLKRLLFGVLHGKPPIITLAGTEPGVLRQLHMNFRAKDPHVSLERSGFNHSQPTHSSWNGFTVIDTCCHDVTIELD